MVVNHRMTLTRSLLSFLAAAVLLPSAARAEDADAISVVVARTIATDPAQRACDTDLGYVVATGPRDGKDTARRRADELARKEYPKARHFSHVDNFGKKDKFLGRHLVVLRAEEKKESCTVTMFGIGFGQDEASATRSAQERLGKSWPMRSETRAPAKVIRSEKL